MRIQKLDNSHFEEIFLLFKKIENDLENRLWLFPCTREWLNGMLTAGKRKTLYGAFSSDNEIMAVQGLSPTMKEVIELLQLNEEETIEMGASIVLPKFRGNGLSVELSRELIKITKLNGYKNIIAKTYPDNIASSKSLLNLGMQLKKTITIQEKYIRDIYLLKF